MIPNAIIRACFGAIVAHSAVLSLRHGDATAAAEMQPPTATHLWSTLDRMLPLANGNVVVASARADRIVVVGPDGSRRATLRLPFMAGEMISDILARGDTLVVLSNRGRLFHAAPATAVRVSSLLPIEATSRQSAVRPQVLLPDSTVAGVPRFDSHGWAAGGDSLPLIRGEPGGRTHNTIGFTHLGSSLVAVRRPGGMVVISLPGYSSIVGNRSLWKLTPSHAHVLVFDELHATEPRSGMFRVRTMGYRGDTVSTRRYRYQPVPLPRKTVDSLLFAALRTAPQSALEPITLGELREHVRPPEFYPAVHDALVSPSDRIWVRRGGPTTDAQQWWPLTEGGGWGKPLNLPADIHAMAVTDAAIWGVMRAGSKHSGAVVRVTTTGGTVTVFSEL
jgi:hypothetical protein